MGVEADAVIRLGMLLMGAGTSGYRVIRAMKRAARALGFDRMDAVVGVTQITSTFHRGDSFRTIVARSQSPAVDASRIEALESLSHSLHHEITAEDLNTALDKIVDNVRKRWSLLVVSLAAALACASFAVLNHFAIVEIALVAVSAGLGQAVRTHLHHKHMHQLGCVVAAGTVACLTFFALAHILIRIDAGETQNFTAGYVAAVLFLVPGFPLFSAMIDLGRFDFDAGVSRLVYAVTVILTATFSVAMISWATGLNPEPVIVEPGSSWYAVAALASFVGIGGFAFLFNSSRRMALVAATVGTTANVIRLLLEANGSTGYFAVFIGGLIIGLFGAVASKSVNLPRITTTVPAAVILMPGTAMFRAVYYLNRGDMDQALVNAATAMMVVFSISVGLVLARLLTDKSWTYGKLIEFDKLGHD
ncbi:threonine/serine exporter ThrE family protein [Corynebacterium ulcerans]|uniref:threonine/serine exporter ThrE family protein n=1 Tax=Corynebacterium ulcerans TaxID=65058 RepID=UPI0034A1B56A